MNDNKTMPELPRGRVFDQYGAMPAEFFTAAQMRKFRKEGIAAALAQPAGGGDLWVRNAEKDACSDGCCGGCAFTRAEDAIAAMPASGEGVE